MAELRLTEAERAALSALARAGARARWDKATPEQRKAQGAALAAGRRRAAAKRKGSSDRDE